jgi:thiol-disulfide isomerase/thioredoxin
VFFGPGKPPSGPASDFTLLDLEGQEWTLSQAEAPLIVLNFWFTDCPPCRKEIPDLVRWQEEHPDVPIVGIHVDPRKPPGVVKRVSKQLGINYQVLDDRTGDRVGHGCPWPLHDDTDSGMRMDGRSISGRQRSPHRRV